MYIHPVNHEYDPFTSFLKSQFTTSSIVYNHKYMYTLYKHMFGLCLLINLL